MEIIFDYVLILMMKKNGLVLSVLPSTAKTLNRLINSGSSSEIKAI